MDAARILIADDHPLFRAALAFGLRELFPGAQIFEAASFALLEAAVAQNPEVELVLLDLNMPGAKGLSALIYLRGERPATPVLVISANDQPRTVRRAQQFGAAGFISKAAPLPVLQQAVRAVMAGDEWFPGEKAGKSEEDARLAARLAHLTTQQFRVLMCVADGLVNKQIAFQLGVAENTVKVHVTAILRKLECSSRTQAAVLVKALAMDDTIASDAGRSMDLPADE
ncbi:MAG: response regulator transcription factor [Gammaproteobacteria bacterium]|nr:MAG: response regulator transcription factor [Gammaproteobacteria bacterium]